MRRRLRRAGVVAALILAAGGCSTSSDQVEVGTWGGRNAELVVTSAGATARFKCNATGIIGQRLLLQGGAFDVPGSYLTTTINLGVQPARYTGSVSGSDMTLQLSVNGQPSGTFQLHRGSAAAFDVCNFSG